MQILFYLIGFMLLTTGCNNDKSKSSDYKFAYWCMEQGRATHYTHADTLSSEQWKQAKAWIDRHESVRERAQAALFLGRAYAKEEKYDLAMQTYADALRLAQTHEQYNIAGYICTYMADLYRINHLSDKIREKYAEAASLFSQAGNSLSQAYALNHLATEYAFIDSFSIAKLLMKKVDSIARAIKVQRLDYNIANTRANIHYLEQRYDSAVYYFKRGITLDTRHRTYDSIGLAESYIALGDPVSAKALVDRLYPRDSNDYTLNDMYGEIYKSLGNYKEALHYKEISFTIYDSIIITQSKADVLEVEQKYNNLKMQEENQRLENARQRYLLYMIILFCCFLIGGLIFYFYRKDAKQKIHWQKERMDRLNQERILIIAQLEKTKHTLTILKNNNQEERMHFQNKITFLTEQYQRLQQLQLTSSSIYKKLTSLCSKKQPNKSKALLNEKLWKALSTEINIIYPHFHNLLFKQCPHLTDEEWQYCYLHILGFDSNDEAVLLGILPTSVSVKRNRIKQKLAKEMKKESRLIDILTSYCQSQISY